MKIFKVILLINCTQVLDITLKKNWEMRGRFERIQIFIFQKLCFNHQLMSYTNFQCYVYTENILFKIILKQNFGPYSGKEVNFQLFLIKKNRLNV